MYGTESERLQGIKSALMISYAFAGSLHDTLMFHASAVMHEGSGYMFIAPSGTGKSTHSQNWIRMIPGTKLLNDDTPIVRLTNRQVRIYGSPWSGKTPCYRNICVPLKGVARIERATENRIIKKEGVDAFASLLIACAIMKREKSMYWKGCDIVSQIATKVCVYTLYCTASPGSALVFAGPNGSGKSTIKQYFEIVGEYTNADDVVSATGKDNLEAAKEVDAKRYALHKNHQALEEQLIHRTYPVPYLQAYSHT